MEFAVAARRLAGVAAIHLGWRPAEFWAATPDELAAVFEALVPADPAAIDLDTLMRMHPDG